MKASGLFLGAAIIVALASCSQSFIEDPSSEFIGKQLVFHAISGEMETKSAFQSDHSSIWWSKGDAVSIFYGASDKNYFVATNTEDEFASATFSGTLTAFTGENAPGTPIPFWAVYPYNSAVSCDGSSVVAVLPSHQEAKANSFANNTNVTIAKSYGLNLGFFNTCSWLRISVTNDRVKTVILSCDPEESIAGEYRVSMNNEGKPTEPVILTGESEIILSAPEGEFLEPGTLYYITLLPGTYENGVSITLLTDHSRATRIFPGPRTFNRSSYKKAENVDESLVYESTNSVITYTTSDNSPVTPQDDAFDSEIVSQEFENGTGTIAFSGSITEIGDGAFMGCSNLQTITIPETVTTIGADAFRETGLKGIEIPASVESVGIGAFASCPDLSDMTVSSDNVYLDSRDDCNAIIETSSNTLIAGCQNTVIPEDVEDIARMAFYGCENLENIVIPNSVSIIRDYTFYGCNSLDRIAIPDALTEIGDHAFSECSSLKNISILAYQYVPVYFYIPETVTRIGKYAFAGCSCIDGISLPESVTDVGEHAFERCTSLYFAYINSGNTIADYLFYGCTSLGLGDVRFSDSVTSIGEHAFDGCTSLQWLFIPRYLERIGSFAFNGCSRLTGLAIRDTVTEIGNNAFSGCSSLVQVTIPSSVTEIKDYTFYGCSSLESPILQSTITRIGAYAFSGCTNFTGFNLPGSVTEIDDYAFSGCENFTEFILPASVTTIGDYAFSDCSSMTSFTAYPRTPPTTGIGIFDGCKVLRTIYADARRYTMLPWTNYNIIKPTN